MLRGEWRGARHPEERAMARRGPVIAVLLRLLGAGLLLARNPPEQVARAESPLPNTVEVPPSRIAGAPPVQRDLAQIRERKALVVLAPYNSTSYFIYRGEPMGYEYDLLKGFANDLKLALKVVV